MAELDFSIIKNIEDVSNGVEDGLIHSQDLTNQQEIDDAYNALIEQSWEDLNAEIYKEIPTINKRFTQNVMENFIDSVIDTDKFQEKNILITAQMWNDLMKTPKQIVNMGMFQRSKVEKETKSEDIRIYNFSFLSKGKISGTKKTGWFLTTIQFELPIKKSIIAAGIMKTVIAEFERLMQEGSSASLYQICNLAGKTENFSIHHYFLQKGLEQGCVSSAILLTRYDHCPKLHKNDVLPRMYEMVYKKYTSLPHFHFNASFGNIYKLNNKHQSYNNGVGYAISVDGLFDYLEELQNSKKGDVFAENSFGMPFLGKRNKDIEQLQYNLNKLAKAIKAKDKCAELRLALEVLLKSANTKTNMFDNIQEDRFDDINRWNR